MKKVGCFLILGTLHPGDEIREINGINVADKSVENLQALLVRVIFNKLESILNLRRVAHVFPHLASTTFIVFSGAQPTFES